MKLAMYVAADCDGGVNMDHVAFFDQKLSCFVAELTDLRLRNGSTGP